MTAPGAIAELAAGPKTPEAIDAFFSGHSFPIVDGPAITFIWRGEAEAVHLKHWVFGLPSSQQLARVEGTDVWHLTLELPPEARAAVEQHRGHVAGETLAEEIVFGEPASGAHVFACELEGKPARVGVSVVQ